MVPPPSLAKLPIISGAPDNEPPPLWNETVPPVLKQEFHLELLKERHGDTMAANAQAQIRKLLAARPLKKYLPQAEHHGG